MQIAEDLQLIVGHICMQWLSMNFPARKQRQLRIEPAVTVMHHFITGGAGSLAAS